MLPAFLVSCGLFESPHRLNPYDPKAESNYFYPYLTNTVGIPQNVFSPPVHSANPYAVRNQKIVFRLPSSYNGKKFSKWRMTLGDDSRWDTNWSASRTFSFSTGQTGRIPVLVDGLWENAVVYRFSNQGFLVPKTSPGKFTLSQTLPNGVSGSSLALGDLDGDGDLDLVMSGFDGSAYHLKIFVNDGTGKMTLSQSLSPGVSSASLALGDLDGDGDLDLVMSGDDGSGKHFKIFRNDGAGKFSLFQTMSPGIYQSSLVLGDLDGDGDLDLVMSGYDTTTRHLRVYANDGTGTFTLAQTLSPGVTTSSLALGDLDGDGDLDLMMSGDDGSVNHLKAFTNDGTGKFFLSQSLSPGVSTSSVGLGDFDGDGDLDLAMTGYDGSGYQFKVYANDGAGKFTLSQSLSPGLQISSTALGDIDGDGDIDLLVSGDDGVGGKHFKSFANDGTGKFTLSQSLSPGVLGGSLVFGDLDGDGDLDLVMSGFDGSTRYLQVHKNQ